MDLSTLIAQMTANGDIQRIVNNPLAQFGTRERAYLGATILPEQTQEANAYTEDMIRYRSVIANDGTRYSPVQMRGGALVGSFDVKLAESDAGAELTSRMFDALRKYLGAGDTPAAVAAMTRFLDSQVVIPLMEINELHRWEAIVEAVVHLRGDNGFTEDVAYTNPAGHRAAASAAWSTDATDPFDDIFAMVQKLADKGYGISRIITSTKVVGIMGGNDQVKARTGRVQVAVGGGSTISLSNGRASLGAINGALRADGLPPIETYDLQYRTMTGSGRFMPDNVMIFVGTSGRDDALDLGDAAVEAPEVLTNTLGYVGVGVPAGQSQPGRTVNVEVFTNKPPRVVCEGWQTSLPVVTEPEALAVINSIA